MLTACDWLVVFIPRYPLVLEWTLPVHDKFNTLFSMVTVLEKLSRNEGRAAKVKDKEYFNMLLTFHFRSVVPIIHL